MSEDNILIIDDDPAVRKAFRFALEDTHFHIDDAESGEEGINQINQKEYVVVFIDLKMPGLNGAETLRKIRNINHHVPIYIVTAFHKEFLSDLQSLKEDGIKFELLRKPLGADDILLLVNSVLI